MLFIGKPMGRSIPHNYVRSLSDFWSRRRPISKTLDKVEQKGLTKLKARKISTYKSVWTLVRLLWRAAAPGLKLLRLPRARLHVWLPAWVTLVMGKRRSGGASDKEFWERPQSDWGLVSNLPHPRISKRSSKTILLWDLKSTVFSRDESTGSSHVWRIHTRHMIMTMRSMLK